jgi:hypothetical protein
MTSFQTNSPSNLTKNHLPLPSLSKNLSRSQRKEKLEKMIRNSNSGSLIETLTLFISDSRTKAIKSIMIMVSNRTTDINLISTQVFKENAALAVTLTKLGLRPKKMTGIQTSELPSGLLNLEQPFTIKLLLQIRRLHLDSLMLSK